MFFTLDFYWIIRNSFEKSFQTQIFDNWTEFCFQKPEEKFEFSESEKATKQNIIQ